MSPKEISPQEESIRNRFNPDHIMKLGSGPVEVWQIRALAEIAAQLCRANDLKEIELKSR